MLNKLNLVDSVIDDPVTEERYSSVDAWVLGVTPVNSPRGGAKQDFITHQRATRITLDIHVAVTINVQDDTFIR